LALLRNKRSGRVWVPEPDAVVGRSPRCELRLDEGYVSVQQAGLRWSGEVWELRDLGSRNGTRVDGQPLQPGVGRALRSGAVIWFGNAQQEWVFEDDAPPRPMIAPLAGGDPIFLDGDLLGVPSADDPQATIYRGSDGRWILERADASSMTLDSGSVFEAGGLHWRFVCPDFIASTTTAHQPLQVHELRLQFGVSRDEEHVELVATLGDRRFDLGSRGHNYLLLTLARRRLEDARAGLPDTSCGWVYQDDLGRDLDIAVEQLNVDVFRIRKQIAGLGLADATNIIERRPRVKQLRIGVSGLEIRAL
jgi:hypothetical protein